MVGIYKLLRLCSWGVGDGNVYDCSGCVTGGGGVMGAVAMSTDCYGCVAVGGLGGGDRAGGVDGGGGVAMSTDCSGCVTVGGGW